MTWNDRERADEAQAFGNRENQECMTMKDARETLRVRVEPITVVATYGFALAPLSLKLS